MSLKFAVIIFALSVWVITTIVYVLVTLKRREATLNKLLLLNMAEYTIMTVCSVYLNQNYISQDELNTLITKLYLPYTALGGNGYAHVLMEKVAALPVTSSE